MTRLTFRSRCLFLSVILCAASLIAHAQILTTLASFDGSNGASPISPLVQGIDGNFYGVSYLGGPTNCSALTCDGTLFRVTPAGDLTVSYYFGSLPNFLDGVEPMGTPFVGIDGNIRGTTSGGGIGTPAEGTVYEFTQAGELITLGTLNGTDGDGPYGPFAEADDGNYYGTTSYGGGSEYARGTIFKLTPDGTVTALHTFCLGGLCLDGANPAGLIQATDGNLYGVAPLGGSRNCYEGCGTLFEMTTAGKFKNLHNFCALGCKDGAYPSSLMQGTDGALYGTTGVGGVLGGGTIFKVFPDGRALTLYSFCYPHSGCQGGTNGPLLQASDGNFYGTASGGIYDSGVIYKLSPSGDFTILHSFCDQGETCPDGADPLTGLIQSTDGKFYGTTGYGGADNVGTVFSFDFGLAPFVAFIRNHGRVGQTGGILGQGFTGTTAVTLNGVPTSFTVVSDTYITATIPAGATTGYVTVETPYGPLTSNVPFHVIQ